jgi:hypothetical protein
MPKRTIFTTALIVSLVIGSAALAQTTPTNPPLSPSDPTGTKAAVPDRWAMEPDRAVQARQT